RRLAHRAVDQALPAPPPGADPGLVQGLSRARARRDEAQPPHPRGSRAACDERCRRAGVAEVAVSSALAVEFDDIQGLVRFGYKHHTEAAFLLLCVRDRDAARRWLATVPVSTAATIEPPPEIAIQVALSAEGMRAIGVADDVVAAFATEFVVGMAGDANRARRLGDLGANDPSRWQWGSGGRAPHVAVLLYAMPGKLAALQQAIETQCDAAFERVACLATSDLDGIEPFGFTDGISQPLLDWERKRVARDAERTEYSNLCCLGEVLLGYPNEYGGYTDRPLLDRAAAGPMLPSAEDAPDRADLGRNGSYLVLRQL